MWLSKFSFPLSSSGRHSCILDFPQANVLLHLKIPQGTNIREHCGPFQAQPHTALPCAAAEEVPQCTLELPWWCFTSTSVQQCVSAVSGILVPKIPTLPGCVCLQTSSSQQSRADLQLDKHTFSKCAQPYGDQNFIFLSVLPQETDWVKHSPATLATFKTLHCKIEPSLPLILYSKASPNPAGSLPCPKGPASTPNHPVCTSRIDSRRKVVGFWLTHWLFSPIKIPKQIQGHEVKFWHAAEV